VVAAVPKEPNPLPPELGTAPKALVALEALPNSPLRAEVNVLVAALVVPAVV